MKRLFFMFVSLSCSIIFFGCSVEYNTAIDYVEKFSYPSKVEDSLKIYVALPTDIISTNKKINEIPGFENFSNEKKNELITQNTTFLNKIDMSIFLNQFNEVFLYNLNRIGIPIIVTSAEDLPIPIEGKILTINIAQIEIEEFITIERLETHPENGEYFKQDVDLNGVSLNIWFAYNEKNANIKKVFYKNFETKDKLYGNIFTNNNGKADAIYKISKLNVNDIYTISYSAGKKSATLFIEKWINDFVDLKLKNPSSYFFYSPEKNKVDGSIKRIYLSKKYGFQEIN